MRSVLQSIQPSNHILEAKAAKRKHQLPSVMPAPVVKQPQNPQCTNYTSLHRSQPDHNKASQCHQPLVLRAPSIERKRNAQGRLKNEKDLQAASGTAPQGVPLQAAQGLHSFPDRLMRWTLCNVWDLHMGSAIVLTTTAVPFSIRCSVSSHTFRADSGCIALTGRKQACK